MIHRGGRSVAIHLEQARQSVAHYVDSRLASNRWRQQAIYVIVAIGIALFMVRVLAAAWPTQFKIFFPDSFSFKNAARDTPLSFQFYADERPLAYPTLLFLLGRSTVLTVVVQTLLYALAFVFVAVCAYRLLRSAAMQACAVVLLVCIGLQARFALWNSHILSESLGITLGTVTVALWWRFGATLSQRSLRWAGLATITWLTVRDSNVPPWLAIGVPALLIGSRVCRSLDATLRKSMLRWAVITLCVGIFAALGQAANGRNRYATMNNVGQRVLPDQEITDWFVAQGMPMSPALQERKGFSSFDNDWKMLNSPELVVFRAWANDVGQRQMLFSYVRFMPHWLDKLSGDLKPILAANQSDYDVAFGVSKRLPKPLPWQLSGPTTTTGLWNWAILAFLGIAALAIKRRGQAVVLGLLLLSCAVDIYMAYVGDSVEVQRHMVGPLSRLSVILMLCVLAGADAAFELVRSYRSPVVSDA
jgi:hypothetical protein